MTDQNNPFAAMVKMGQDWARAVNPALESFTPKGFEALIPTMPKNVMEMFLGKRLNPDGLDAKTRLLVTLAGLTIQGSVAEPQLRLTVRHAREAGASKQEIAEAIAIAGLFGGVPAMTKAMGLATEAMKEDRNG